MLHSKLKNVKGVIGLMTVLRIPVAKAVIQWAISHGEKSEEALLKKYRLRAWENPTSDRDYPTFKQVQDFSRDTRIPFNYFFKTTVPREANDFAEFRTVNNAEVQPSRRLIETIHTMASHQEWLKQDLLTQDKATKFKFTHFFTRQMTPTAVARSVWQLLELGTVEHVTMNDDDFFNFLRRKISSLGIMVMQSGIVGSNTRRPLDVSEFRAFVLVDEVVPLIFINSADSKKAKIFSLIHELIHAFLGHSEVLNVTPESTISSERWINKVTIQVLMPANVIDDAFSAKQSVAENVGRLSKRCHTSLVATAIRLASLQIYGEQEVAWAKREQAANLQLKATSSGGNFYNTAVSRVDPQFAGAVIRNESEGKLGVAAAAAMLGVTLRTYDTTVDRILGMA